ncbi:RNA polymerase sigma factor RpoD [uncultured archaeon]|nr:RNA polymerase sigma factor RpoD [uncultured archaeon]
MIPNRFTKTFEVDPNSRWREVDQLVELYQKAREEKRRNLSTEILERVTPFVYQLANRLAYNGGIPITTKRGSRVWISLGEKARLLQETENQAGAISIEDLVAEAIIDLDKNLQNYDASRGTFSTYIGNRAPVIMQRYFLRNQNHEGIFSIDSPVQGWGKEGSYYDVISGGIDEEDSSLEVKEEQVELLERIRRGNLSKKERKVLKLRYGLYKDRKEHKLREIGELMGFKHQYASQLEQSALRKLRKVA